MIRDLGKQFVKQVLSPLADRAGLFDRQVDHLLKEGRRRGIKWEGQREKERES